MKRNMRQKRANTTKVGLMLVGIAVGGVLGLLTAEASAKDKAHRVVAYLHNKSTKKWDLRSKPDLTICVGDVDTKRTRCWPRNRKNNAAGPKTGQEVKKAVCENQDYCYLGCSYMQRIYVSTTAPTTVEVYDVDRYSKNDLMGKVRCYIRAGKKTRCRHKTLSIEFFPYDKNVCRRKKSSSPGRVY